uniref:Uncharacterized protein n=1 Tax=Gossypium raimondii TaxID=29730 RepID=A0A0D2RQD8_GOSRA|nr:hypothetical protein B456_009G061500 [Gossypium raimondii]KJB53404.1 hypothetical protein B456_009G061500 [Gossypium raimondii]
METFYTHGNGTTFIILGPFFFPPDKVKDLAAILGCKYMRVGLTRNNEIMWCSSLGKMKSRAVRFRKARESF